MVALRVRMASRYVWLASLLRRRRAPHCVLCVCARAGLLGRTLPPIPEVPNYLLGPPPLSPIFPSSPECDAATAILQRPRRHRPIGPRRQDQTTALSAAYSCH